MTTGIHDACSYGGRRARRCACHDADAAVAALAAERRPPAASRTNRRSDQCKLCGHIMVGDYEARLRRHDGPQGVY